VLFGEALTDRLNVLMPASMLIWDWKTRFFCDELTEYEMTGYHVALALIWIPSTPA